MAPPQIHVIGWFSVAVSWSDLIYTLSSNTILWFMLFWDFPTFKWLIKQECGDRTVCLLNVNHLLTEAARKHLTAPKGQIHNRTHSRCKVTPWITAVYVHAMLPFTFRQVLCDRDMDRNVRGSRLVTSTEQGTRFQQKHFGCLTPPSINQVVSSQPVGCRL